MLSPALTQIGWNGKGGGGAEPERVAGINEGPTKIIFCVCQGGRFNPALLFLPELMYYLPAPFHLRPHAVLSVRCIIKMTGPRDWCYIWEGTWALKTV